MAVIIPYRAREANLKVFLKHMHPFFIRHELDYQIFLVEPVDGLEFNRALLFNIGYLEALKVNSHWECFVFHDVDLLPEDDRISYKCPEQSSPRHLCTLNSGQSYV